MYCFLLSLHIGNSHNLAHRDCFQAARWCPGQWRPPFEPSPHPPGELPARQEEHWVRGLWRKPRTCRLTCKNAIILRQNNFISTLWPCTCPLSSPLDRTSAHQPRRRQSQEEELEIEPSQEKSQEWCYFWLLSALKKIEHLPIKSVVFVSIVLQFLSNNSAPLSPHKKFGPHYLNDKALTWFLLLWVKCNHQRDPWLPDWG